MSIEQKIISTIRDVPDFPRQGILFKDITPILHDQILCREIVAEFVSKMEQKPDVIAGIESRGFLFGMLLASELNVPFVMIRKAGKLPYKTDKVEYVLEYGTAIIEVHTDSFKPGQKVLVHDDLLATGGTADAAAQLIKIQGAEVFGFAFLVELSFLKGNEKLSAHSENIISLVTYS